MRGKIEKRPFVALCDDKDGRERRVRVRPDGNELWLINDMGNRHLSHTRDIRLEIGTVYQYKVKRFEYL
jgi:hypothetical protein